MEVVDEDRVKRFDAETLVSFAEEFLSVAGLSEDNARTSAEFLVRANLRGVDSHGVMRMRRYLEQIRAGHLNPRPRVEVLQRSTVSELWDGDRGVGFVVGQQAMERSIQIARSTGVGMVLVRDHSHVGALAHYTMMAARNDMIGFMTNNAPPSVPPYGGREGRLGTNPVSFAVPAAEENPVVLDMATTTVANGKIRLAERMGESIPDTWALDEEGKPTTDPARWHTSTWAGGYKGYGLAVVVDCLTGVLSGGLFGSGIPLLSSFSDPLIQCGLFVSIDVGMFQPVEEYKRAMDRYVRDLRSAGASGGDSEVYVPGEPEFRTRARRLREGVPLPHQVVEELDGYAEELDLSKRLGAVGS